MALENAKARVAYIKKTITAKNLVDAGFPVFVTNTPVKTGNARRHTSKSSSTIDAVYPYAQRLDRGYSRQSPDGMTKPTLAAIRAYIAKQLGK
jgi:hypothetical protein